MPEPRSTTHAQPPTRAGLRRILATLCVTQIVGWGVLYYAFPVLVTDISEATGWSTTVLTAGFSGGLLTAAVVGIPVGRRLDRHGPRWTMTAGSALAGPALVVIAVAPNTKVFTAGWLIALGLGGVGQVIGRLGYPTLTRHTGLRTRTALVLLVIALTTALLGLLTTTVTLIFVAIVAGLARGLLTLLQATAVSDRWGTAA